MTSYIAMLKAEIAQTHPPDAPTKLTKHNPSAAHLLRYNQSGDFCQFCQCPGSSNASSEMPYASVFAALEDRCPAYVATADWRQAVGDGRRFLAQWGVQAEALGWTSRDLFGLHKPPDKPGPTYRRLSRYDETGLIWLLRGRPVVALTAVTAAIKSPIGKRHCVPAAQQAGARPRR